MPLLQNVALRALPNVLRDQTLPNTLSGVGPPRPAARRRVPVGTLTTVAGVIVAVAVVLLARAA